MSINHEGAGGLEIHDKEKLVAGPLGPEKQADGQLTLEGWH